MIFFSKTYILKNQKNKEYTNTLPWVKLFLQYAANMLYAYFPLHHTAKPKDVHIQGLKVNKISSSCFIKDMHKWNSYFILLYIYSGEEYNDSQQSLVLLSHFMLRQQQFYPPLLLYPLQKRVCRPHLRNPCASWSGFLNS